MGGCCSRINYNTVSSLSNKDTSPAQKISDKVDSMQMVLPNIFMGSAEAAKNLTLLQEFNITHILGIGWDLVKHFDTKFTYLIINNVEDCPDYPIIKEFTQCFQFINECLNKNDNIRLNKNKNNILIHCHKGLSRSATIIIAYEMYKNGKNFKDVMNEIKKSRSFIMPNIGFQAQLMFFEENKCSLDMNKYNNIINDSNGIYNKISLILPNLLNELKQYYKMFENGNDDDIDDQKLFGLTMYFHQVMMLSEKRALNDTDNNIYINAIKILRSIQTEYIKDDVSIKRFDKLFKIDPNTFDK